jgi:crotonobetainyl-CoA:carnitine CoA-transferase CaiB-like acyl-CoA transferase
MAVDLPGAPPQLGFPPKYGQHTRQVLAEAGLAADAIESLYGAGIVA